MSQVQEVFLFQPTQVSGCSLWLDGADSTTTILTGSNLTQWNDKSTNQYNVTPYSTFSNGTIATRYQNNNNVINFSGYNIYNTSTNAAFYPVDAYLVLSLKSGSTDGHFLSLTRGNGTDWTSFAIGGYSAARWNQSSTGGVRSYDTNTTESTPSPFLLMNWTLANNNFSIRRNTTTIGSTTAFTWGLPTTPSFCIGFPAITSPNVLFDVYMGEIVVFNSVLALSQRQQIEGYLAWKWGLQGNLPATHPYKTYRPLAQTPFPTIIPPMPIKTQGSLPFTPTQISGCSLWLDGADTNSLTLSGTTVTQWRDKSGSNLNFSTTSGSPTYSTGVSIPNAAIMSSVSNYSLTTNTYVYVVSRLGSSSGSINMMLGFTNITPTENTGDYSIRYAANLLNGVPNKVGNVNDFANNNYYVNGFYLPSFSTTAYSAIHIISGQSQFTGSTGVTLSSAFLSRYYTGDIYELLFYSSPPTTAQRQQVEGYLAWKWGLVASLPPGHPYKAAPLAPFPFRTVTFNGNLSSWQPTKISGCQLWLDAADVSTVILSGSSVTQWNDKSGNGRNLTGFGSPTYASNRINLAPNAYLQVGSFPSGTYTLFMLVNQTSGNGPIYTNTTTIGYTGFFPNYAGNYYLVQSDTRWNGSATAVDVTTIPASIPFTNSNVFLYSITYNFAASTALVWANGSISPVINGLISGSITIDSMILGRRGSDYMTGYYNEVVHYNSALTTTQRQQVEGYLAWKWGLQGSLPANHPYKKFPPPP